MKKPLFSLLILLLVLPLWSQHDREKLKQLEGELASIEEKKQYVLNQMEELKLKFLRTDLHRNGLPALEPGEEVIHHKAMSLVYDEEHEQAKWVAHMITPDIIQGDVSRTNDFRRDPMVVSGSSEETDYFQKTLQSDGTYEYDGYGYDRGHLAPSADFRWSEVALSESYFYSNMSPQHPQFNRGKWAELEGLIRGYVFRNPDTYLYVVTGPILNDGLPKQERSPNQLSIPKLYYKVVIDLDRQHGIGFIMPNKEILYPISSFAVSIDKVEEETGIDFFPNLDDELEAALEGEKDLSVWLPEKEKTDVSPIYPPSLPGGHFNTVQAKQYMGKGEEVTVCGTVVSTKLSRKGNVFLNLDKKFPNQIFTVTIWKDNLVNFTYAPDQELMGEQVCVTGKVTNFSGTPSMSLEKEEQLKLYVGDQD
jgi:endonuclease G